MLLKVTATNGTHITPPRGCGLSCHDNIFVMTVVSPKHQHSTELKRHRVKENDERCKKRGWRVKSVLCSNMNLYMT